MTLEYQLSNTDYLAYQLYNSSVSKTHKNKRFRTRVIIPVLYIPLGLFFYFNTSSTTGIIFIVFAIAWFFTYPFYSKWRWKRHFNKFVIENYKNRINKTIEITIYNDHIITKDATSESKLNGSEIKELIETKDHFFAKLTTDLSLVLPKAQISNKSEFIKAFENFGTIHFEHLEWEWK